MLPMPGAVLGNVSSFQTLDADRRAAAAPMDADRIRLRQAVVQEGRVSLRGLRRGSLRANEDYYSGHLPNSSQ